MHFLVNNVYFVRDLFVGVGVVGVLLDFFALFSLLAVPSWFLIFGLGIRLRYARCSQAHHILWISPRLPPNLVAPLENSAIAVGSRSRFAIR